MQESIEEYRARIAGYANEDLKSIEFSIDKEKNPERYAAILEEIDKRKAGNTWIQEPADSTERYRTLLRRIGALLIDSFLFLVILMLVASPFNQLRHLQDSAQLQQQYLLLMIKGLAIQLAFLAYSILFHWRFGATFGKMALGIRVVAYAGEGRITFQQSLLRDVVPLVVLLVSAFELLYYLNSGTFSSDYSGTVNSLWSWAEILTALFSSKRRAIHDRIAKTICVKL